MKKLLTAFALATLAASAGAQVTFAGGTDRPALVGVNANGPAGTLVGVGGREGALINTTAGTLTATFLGFEALDTDTFTFSMGSSGTLSNKGPVGASISGNVGAGLLSFSFGDLFAGTQVGNGQILGDFTSYAVLGAFVGPVFTPFTLGGTYDLILGFNDGMTVDADYDDMVIGLTVVAIPEPESYALMLAGLVAVGFIARRRQRRPQA